MRLACLFVAFLFGCSSASFSAITGIDSLWSDNFTLSTPFTDALGTPLNNGTVADGDGDIVQLGVFDPTVVPIGLDPASYGPAEWAAFTPLTGTGSANPHIATTMGDAAGDFHGFYNIGVVFDTVADPLLDVDALPIAPARVGIRYYDGNQLGANSAWNTVTSSDGGWVMNPPADPFALNANASLDAQVPTAPNPPGPGPGLVWEGGLDSAFKTVIPEPSVSLLALLGGAIFLRRRRS